MFQERPWTLNQTVIKMEPVKSEITRVKKLAKNHTKKYLKKSVKRASNPIKRKAINSEIKNRKFITFKLFGWLVVLKQL